MFGKVNVKDAMKWEGDIKDLLWSHECGSSKTWNNNQWLPDTWMSSSLQPT